MIKHYAEFLYPGSFMSETGVREVERRDAHPLPLPERAYGWRFYDREAAVTPSGKVLLGDIENESPWTYIGEIFDVERVKREVPDNRILVLNMEGNGWSRVVKCWQGFIPLKDGETVLSERPS